MELPSCHPNCTLKLLFYPQKQSSSSQAMESLPIPTPIIQKKILFAFSLKSAGVSNTIISTYFKIAIAYFLHQWAKKSLFFSCAFIFCSKQTMLATLFLFLLWPPGSSRLISFHSNFSNCRGHYNTLSCSSNLGYSFIF